ncbi:hypothetical protein NOF55_23315 [Rhizobiaceae bacterium BDR2-2]|uniref:Uncharacterized protein n=1 Tax=Ectorhizobium quercum TaxID=2965071 RepID=A0AAE3N5F5_9HYPH|nr:hypothetical protein [Ectorhizobium quercum]MCX9000034.1 hypothetical protein [Ectorhizobium quercum]
MVDPYLVLANLQWSNAELMANEDAAPENWQNGPGASAHKTWLLSKTNYDQRHMKWRQLGSKLVERLTEHHSEQIVEKVKLIAFLLSKKS